MAGRGGAAAPPPVTNVLDLPGTNGNYASTPDSAAASVTSDIDIRCQVALDAWDSSSGAQALVAKYGAAGQRSYTFRKVSTADTLQILLSSDGSSVASATSTAGTGFTNGTVHWVRVTWDNAANLATFYTSEDGSAWTPLGTTVALSATGIFDGTAVLEIGAFISGTSTPAAGQFYYAEVRNGIDGTVVASFDATAVTKLGTRNPTTVPVGGTAGGNWTINGSAWDWVAP